MIFCETSLFNFKFSAMNDKCENQNNSDWSNWMGIIKKYNQPSLPKSWGQIANSFIPFFALWVVMVCSIDISYWLTLGLSVLAAGFLVRIFIIFHDCGHGSFFKSPLMNRIVGIVAGMLVFTPYHKWHYSHKIHHQTVGNLDKRGVGDVMTLTVAEYNNLSTFKRFSYRIYRNPFVLLLLAPFFIFTVLHRLPGKNRPFKENLFTHLTTLGIIAIITGVSLLIGFKTFLLIEVPLFWVASVHGVWLFYVQHQFKWVTWKRNETWNYRIIAMEGSSYLKLPKVLQWFTGNIGFHHIHHLSSLIPNYNLEKCYRENPIFQDIKPLNFFTSLDSVRYRLWDEQKRKLVGFKEALRQAIPSVV
jgi:omega-6 fatty acid desaturase (delta-12 desaturase)